MPAPITLRFPHDLGTGETSHRKNFIKFSFYNKKKGVNKSLQKELIYPVIYLPLTSDAFREILTASYSNEQLGIIGNLIFNESKMDVNSMSIESIVEGFKTAASIESIKNQLNTFKDVTIATAQTGVGLGAKYAENIAYNPNITLFFNGGQQNYRFFRLGWTLYPRSEEEGESLRQIEKVFLKYSLPGTQNNSDNTVNFNYNNTYTYPYELQMEIYIDNLQFFKFQFMPSIVQYIDISHHDNQQQNEMTFLKKNSDGRLLYASTTLNLGIQEKEVFVRQYVDKLKEEPIFNPINSGPF